MKMKVAFYSNATTAEPISTNLARMCKEVELNPLFSGGIPVTSEETKPKSHDVALINADRLVDSYQMQRITEDCASIGMPYVLIAPSVSIERVGINFSSAAHVEVVFPPHNPEEIFVRLQMAVSRSSVNKTSPKFIVRGPLSIDPVRYEVSVSGSRISLTYKEYGLLKFLAEQAGRVFSREILLENVWGYDFFGGMRTVDVHVRRVRSKLGDMDSRMIETVRGVGYRFRIPTDE